ncbi:MAG: glycine oxidase ThiO [Euzebya sp.]
MAGDVVIIGAGVIGLSSAVACADAGLTVTLIDPEPGRGASWAAAGMLAPVTELHYGEDAVLRFALAASRRWETWARDLGQRGAVIGYDRCGSLMVARDGDDAAELRRLMVTQVSLGLTVEWLRSREARAAEPGLAASIRGAVLVEGDHQVDNRALVRGLLGVVGRTPQITLSSERANALLTTRGRVRGVLTSGGTQVGAGVVVLAAGAHSSMIRGLPPGLDVIRPVKGQLLHLRSPSGPLASANLRGLEAYIVNRPDGRLVVGATVEERGFDTTVTAGGVSQLLRAAWELLPGIDDCELVQATAGLRPGSPDNAPLLGLVQDVEGLILATGHYRNGVLLSPVTADVVAALATGKDPGLDLTAFRPGRFTTDGVVV